MEKNKKGVENAEDASQRKDKSFKKFLTYVIK